MMVTTVVSAFDAVARCARRVVRRQVCRRSSRPFFEQPVATKALLVATLFTALGLAGCGGGSGEEATTGAPGGGTFYVAEWGNDAGPGTASAPWKTIGKAAATLMAGDTGIVMDGTYTEPEVVFRNSGTSTAAVTLRAQNKHQAILSSTSGCNPNISIYASYVVIENMRFVIAPTNQACGSHNSADGTAVRCWHSRPASVSNESTGYVGCVVRGIRVDASAARSHAVKSTQDFALVEDGELYSGITALNAYGNVFRNNTILESDAFGSSLVAKGGVRNFEAYNNVIRIRNTFGIGLALGGITEEESLYDPASGVEAYNSIAYNNVIINESGGPAEALSMMGAANSAVFNNIVINGSLMIGPGSTSTETHNPTIQNNIVVCNGADAFQRSTYTGTLNLNHNNFHNCGEPPPQDQAVVGDPMFVDPSSDWRLRPGSPAIGKGAPVTVTGFRGEALVTGKDKNGKSRTTPWDLGVYASN